MDYRSGLRRYGPLSEFPIIALVVSSNACDAAAFGANVLLVKPVDPAALVHTVQQHVAAVPGGPSRVLVVDDELEPTELIAESVRSSRLLPVLAAGGKQALEALERGPIDLAVVDLMMPEMSGFELIARIRRNPSWSSLPIVVLTGKQMGSAEIEALAKQTEAVFLKGSDWKHSFLSKVRTLLKNALNSSVASSSRKTAPVAVS